MKHNLKQPTPSDKPWRGGWGEWCSPRVNLDVSQILRLTRNLALNQKEALDPSPAAPPSPRALSLRPSRELARRPGVASGWDPTCMTFSLDLQVTASSDPWRRTPDSDASSGRLGAKGASGRDTVSTAARAGGARERSWARLLTCPQRGCVARQRGGGVSGWCGHCAPGAGVFSPG